MAGTTKVYHWLGVNTTKDPVQLEDGELTKAQNAFRDAAGEHGALRKRPGLTKINSIALAGSILGFSDVPIAAISTRRFLVGVDQAVTPAYQWITSSDEWSTSATAVIPSACSAPADAFPTLDSTRTLTNRGVQGDGFFIYPATYVRGAPQAIRIWDGVVDQELFKIPLSPAVLTNEPTNYSSSSGGVTQMLIDGQKLYLVSHDFTSGAAPHYGRILEYDFQTGVVSQIGKACSLLVGDIGSTGGALIFFSIAIHQGFLYAGVGNMISGETSTGSGVYRIRPGVDADWVYDLDNSANTVERPMCMTSYKGLLYVGMYDLDSSTARMMVRSAVGAYTASTTMVGTSVGSCWTDMLVFGDNLYACSYDKNGASSRTRIHKFDGTTWSVVKTIDSGTSTPRMGVAMVVHRSRLFVLGINASKDGIVTHTADGSSWTDHTTNLAGTNLVSVFGVLDY